MSKITEIICDGCGERGEWKRVRPRGWRRLHVSGDGQRQWCFDVCSPRCASKVVDATYEDEDRDEYLRHHRMRVVPS